MTSRTAWLPAIALVLLATALVLFGALPLLLIVGRAMSGPDGFAPLAWITVVARPEHARALLATIRIALGSTAFAVGLGVPLAFALTRFELAWADGFRALLSVPAAVPPYLWGIAWIDLANPRTGLLNRIAAWVGVESPPFDVYGPGGIVWVLGLSFFPLVMLPVAAALEGMDASLEEAARLSGSQPLRALRDVTLPLVAPSIASAAVLVFLLAASAFGVPYLLGTGGPVRTAVLTTAIVGLTQVGGAESLRQAMSLALGLMVLSVLAGALGSRIGRSTRRFAVVSGKAQRVRPIRLSAAGRRMVLGLVTLVMALIALPVVTLAVVSLIRAWGAGWGPGNWWLGNVRRVLVTNHETGPALLRSLVLGVTTATLVVSAGGGLAYLRARRPSLVVRALAWMAELPYAVPGTVLALGLLLAWSQEVRLVILDRLTVALDLFAGPFALLTAYSVKYLSFPLRTAGSALTQLDPSLEEAARISGASQARAALDVVMPLLLPALGAAWLLVFLPVLSEITMSVLLVGPGTSVVGTVLFDFQSYADPPSAAVLASLLIGATLLGHGLARRLASRAGS